MKIVVYPIANKNPYQRLLYGALHEQFGLETAYLPTTRSTLLFFPLILIRKRLQGFRIFHLHWPTFYVAKSYPQAQLLSLLLSLYCVTAIRLAGLKLVWTVHNAVPHETETSDDLRISRFIARHAAGKIVHSNSVLEEMKTLDMDTSESHIIPHGNYDGIYPVSLSRQQARHKLGIATDEFVLLFFGMVRPYKGIDDLLAAYGQNETEQTRLLIVGRCKEQLLTDEIVAASKHLRIGFYPGFVDDDDVAAYFQASDVVCLPFKAVTTSGSALLALTFGKPLIAPLTGPFLDMPKRAGYFYDPAQLQGLSDSMHAAITETSGREVRQKTAQAYARTLNWDAIARQTYDLYERAIG